MSATFNASLPNERDYLRLTLADAGDNTTTSNLVDPFFQDETLDTMLLQLGYVEALIQCATAMLRKFSGYESELTVDDQKWAWRDRIKALEDLIKAANEGNIQPPNGPWRVGMAVSYMTAGAICNPPEEPDMQGFRVR